MLRDEVHRHYNYSSGEVSNDSAAGNKEVEDSDIGNAVGTTLDEPEDILDEGEWMTSVSAKRLKIAEVISRSMNHLSDQQLARFLVSVLAVNCSTTVQDLQILRAAKGPFMQCLGGMQKISRDVIAATEPADSM